MHKDQEQVWAEDLCGGSKDITVYFALDSFLGLFSTQESSWQYGGAEMQMYYLAEAFSQTPNTKVVLLTTNAPPVISMNNVSAYKLKEPIKHGIPILSRYINDNRKRSNFSHHSGAAILLTSQLESMYLINSAKELGLNVVYRINGDSLVDKSGVQASTWLDEVHKRVDAATHVVTQTNYQHDQLLSNYSVESTVIPNGYPHLETTPCTRTKSILWIGRCVPLKRPWIVLELAKMLPAYEFVMVCPNGDPLLTLEMEREASKLTNVRYLLGVEHHELLTYYARASAVINTSSSEGMPNTLIEASFSKTPYVSFSLDFGGIVGTEGIGLCAHNNILSLKTILERLMDDGPAQIRMGESAFAYASQTWSMTKTVSKYCNLFKSLPMVVSANHSERRPV